MIKEYVRPLVILGSVLIASVLLAILFFLVDQVPAPEYGDFQGRAELTVIPMPTRTPTPPLPTGQRTPSPTPGEEIQVGGFVKIDGTGGEGLRLRGGPSLSAEINYLGLEDEVFRVLDGPVDQDGYLWWHLEAPANPARVGWAVSNYLTVDQPPQ